MNSFDPMAAAIDWLDAYRAASSSIVDMYADDGALECGCGGLKILCGRTAIATYWQQRFQEMPAGDLDDLQIDGDEILVSYCVANNVLQAALSFDASGKIKCSRCGPRMKPAANCMK
jgi:hypothetical protein